MPSSAFGSSPRVRGTGGMILGSPPRIRFIPAGAGTGCYCRTWITGCAVHPRGCGERRFHYMTAWKLVGSSPRVRGTELEELETIQKHRFIPAGAGNGFHVSIQLAGHPVHPRGCGERVMPADTTFSDAGSSPRVRGTGTDKSMHNVSERFIPAGAGNGPSGTI